MEYICIFIFITLRALKTIPIVFIKLYSFKNIVLFIIHSSSVMCFMLLCGVNFFILCCGKVQVFIQWMKKIFTSIALKN